jgi:hypothetical protein
MTMIADFPAIRQEVDFAKRISLTCGTPHRRGSPAKCEAFFFHPPEFGVNRFAEPIFSEEIRYEAGIP